jgi:hypothetical protein
VRKIPRESLSGRVGVGGVPMVLLICGEGGH